MICATTRKKHHTADKRSKMEAKLRILSYNDIDPDAIHYYGEISIGDGWVAVNRTLSQREATALNKAERRKGDSRPNYKVGHVSTRFLSEDEVIAAAIDQLQKDFPDVVHLIDDEEGTILWSKKGN